MGLSTVRETGASPECEGTRAAIEQLKARQIRAVIFDLDGVIADSHILHERAWRDLLGEAGQTPTADLSEIVRAGKTRNDTLKTLFPEYSSQELISLGTRKDTLYQENSGELRPVAGVIEWIRELHREGFSLAVATSASRQRALSALHQFGVEHLFKAIVTASEVAAGKPDPAVFLAAADTLGIEPNRTLVIEDSEAGLVGAKDAGMKCAFYSPGSNNPRTMAVQPDFVLHAFGPECLWSFI
jgi:HAD superfamily hydrolase (TIGR01509 family)